MCWSCRHTRRQIDRSPGILVLEGDLNTDNRIVLPFSRNLGACCRRDCGELSGNEGCDGCGRVGERCAADIADGFVKGRQRKPLNELRQDNPLRLLHLDDHSHWATGDFTGSLIYAVRWLIAV